MAQRVREKQIIVRVTDEEHEIICRKMHMSGIKNKSLFIRKMLLQGMVVKMDMSVFKELTHELAAISKNINQIVHRANETRSIYEQDILDLREEIYKLRRECTTKLIGMLDML